MTKPENFIHYKALILIPAFYGFLLTSDRATLLAFSANERLGEVFAQTSLLGVAMLVGACSLGAAVSSLFAGLLCERFGLQNMTRLACIIWCIGCFTSFFAPQNVYIVLCKLAKGFGLGIVSVSAPLYIFEVLVTPHRSSAIGWAMAFGILGEATMFGLGILLRTSLASPPAAFHYCWLAEIFWGVLVFSTSFCFPDTPVFLARKGEWEKATAVLDRLVSHRHVSLTSVPLQPIKFVGLFAKAIRTRFLLGLAVQFLARACCVLSITHVRFYTLEFCRVDAQMFEALAGAFLGLQFFFACLSVWVMKSSRRKDMLAYGFFLLTVAFTILGSTSFKFAETAPSPIIYAPPDRVRLVPASSIMALLGLTFSVTSLLVAASAMSFAIELLPSHARARGVSVAVSTAYTVDTLAAALGVGLSKLRPFILFFVLAGVSFAGMILVVFVHEDHNPSEGIPFPLQITEELIAEDENKSSDGEAEEDEDAEEGDAEGDGDEEDTHETSYDNRNSEESSKAGSIRRLGAGGARGQNFVPMQGHLGDREANGSKLLSSQRLPKFVVTEPVLSSEFSDSQMKTADTRLSSRRDVIQAMAISERDAFENTKKSIPQRIDSKVTVSGVWSNFSEEI